MTDATEITNRLVPVGKKHSWATADVLYRSFQALYEHHRFPGAYPSVEAAQRVTRGLIANTAIWGIAAIAGERVLGSGFLDERASINAIGPVSVDPLEQHGGIGRQLTEALLDRATGASDVRLLQDTFNRTSFALYTSLGLGVRESIVLLAGRPRSRPVSSVEVRGLDGSDLGECERLYSEAHGHERGREVADALTDPLCAPLVAVQEGSVVAYSTTLTYFPAGHAVARTEFAMQQLILGAAALQGPVSFLLPASQCEMLRWCLKERLRIIKPMSYLTLESFESPSGCWIPSGMF